jgi:hypothetical protein
MEAARQKLWQISEVLTGLAAVHPSGRDPLAGACVMSSSTTIARAVCMLRLKK